MFKKLYEIIFGVLDSPNFAELFKGKEKIRLEMQAELTRLISDNLKGQIEINKEEAKHTNIFVSGWRPAIGWICAFVILYQYVIRSFIDYYIVINFLDVQSPPSLDLSVIIPIITGMLGIFGIRTYEKVKTKK